MMNWKDMEGSVHGLIYGTILALPGGTEENHENLRMPGIWAEIWTQDLPNMKQEF
jgi:hypothetical protein